MGKGRTAPWFSPRGRSRGRGADAISDVCSLLAARGRDALWVEEALRLPVEAGDGGAVFDGGAVVGGGVEGVGDGTALGLAGAFGFLRFGFAAFAFDLDLARGLAAAALDREVFDAVAGVDDVFAAHSVEAVFAGLAEHRVGAAVADQDVPVEGALHVLVGRREVDVLAALDGRDPSRMGHEGDDQDAGMGL